MEERWKKERKKSAFDFKLNNALGAVIFAIFANTISLLETGRRASWESLRSYVNYIDSFLFVLYNQSRKCTRLFLFARVTITKRKKWNESTGRRRDGWRKKWNETERNDDESVTKQRRTSILIAPKFA